MLKEFSLFGFNFHWYGLILGMAILSALTVAEKIIVYLYPNELISKKDVERSFWWVAIFGLIGARLYHVIDYFEYYSSNLTDIWKLWNGGLGIYGAIMGGVVGLWFWTILVAVSEFLIDYKGFFKKIFAVVGLLLGRRPRPCNQLKITNFHPKDLNKVKNVRVRVVGMLDIYAIGIPLGQAIGRMGNWVNQELYGKPTDLVWKIYINPENRISGYERVSYYHPLFFYEAVWNLLGFIGLWFLAKNKKLGVGRGNYFLVYLFWYSSGRTLLEPLRINSWQISGWPVASLVGMTIMFVTGLIFLVKVRHNEWKVLVD